MAKKQKTPPEATALVRAADGTLYLISKTKETITVTREKKEKIEQIIQDAEDKISEVIAGGIPTGPGVHHAIVEVFDHH